MAEDEFATIRVKRDTAALLNADSTPPFEGEIVYDTTAGALKIGDGSSSFSQLPDLRKQFSNVVTVAKTGKKGFADFICSDSAYSSDDECIQAAIDYCATNNLTELFIGPGTYTPLAQINVTHNIHIYCSKNTFWIWTKTTVDAYAMINARGSLSSTLTASSDIIIGADSVTVSSTTEVSAGDLILIYDDTLWNPIDSTFQTLKTGELHEVIDADDTTIYFADSSIHAYSVTNNFKIGVIKPISVIIENIDASGIDSTSAQILINLVYNKNTIIRNCKTDHIGYTSVYIWDSLGVNVEKCYITRNLNTGYGYGISAVNSSAHIYIHDNTVTYCKHCVSVVSNYTIGEARDIRVYNNDVIGGGANHTIDAHECTESFYVYNNIIRSKYSSGRYGIKSGAKITKVTNNIFYDCCGVGIRGSIQNTIFSVENNYLFNGGYLFSDAPEESFTNTVKYANISNNHLFNCRFYMVYTAKSNTIDIVNNTMDQASSYYGIRIHNATDGKIYDNTLSNQNRSAIYLLNCSNLTINGNQIEDCNLGNNTLAGWNDGIALMGSSNIQVTNNRISNPSGLAYYCILENGTSNSNTIENNTVGGATHSQILKIGSSTTLWKNLGHRTENTGIATILMSGTSIVVEHGLVAAPTRINVTPFGDVGYCWADTFTSTQFTIHCSTAPASDVDVSWSVQVV